MSIKKRAKTIIFIICIYSSSLFSEKINEFKVNPKKVNKNQLIEITIPSNPPDELSIITPENDMIYVDEFFKRKGYPSKKNIKFNINEIYGYKYVDGKKKISKVFKQNGKYEFYFAENLETESENTYHISYTVNYINK